MRIVAGSLGGQIFEAPKGHRTHPMGDKIRGALFNMLGDIEGLTVLDTFAGSGALCFEAISRGAKHATAIEIDKTALTSIEKNVASLKLEDKITVIAGHADSWSRRHKTEWFDLVLFDPPYDRVQERFIEKLSTHAAYGGVVVLSWPAHLSVPVFERLELIKSKTYANAQLIIFRKKMLK